MADSSESDGSIGDLLGDDATASLQLGQVDPPLLSANAAGVHQPDLSDDEEGESCEEVSATEPRSRINASADKSLLAEVLSTPPFAFDRKAVTGVWKGISNRLNQSISANFSFRACRDRTSLLLRQYAVRKKRNEGASGTSHVHTYNHHFLEQLEQLKNAGATQNQARKNHAATKTLELETAGQRLMQAAEEMYSIREANCWSGNNGGKPKRRHLSALLEKEQEEAAECRRLEEMKVGLHREELQLRRDELEQQRHQHELLHEQIKQQAAQTESLLKLLTAAICEENK
ncbi:hypothetical protein PHYPSEUDO_008700 [Phytophthora pseudosyringae]|uniref:Uncharacterized protein n=1 Tax=Phytophthora pseudosyringae TaxID=221518 RepID=A0A8T1VIV2_9STRA|nr:hypothetical protein PHYPSEUDO_008700 [Phytophthora pseudosyringae]